MASSLEYAEGGTPCAGDVVHGVPEFSPYGSQVPLVSIQGVVVETVHAADRVHLKLAVVRPVAKRSAYDEPIPELAWVAGDAARFSLVYRPPWAEEKRAADRDARDAIRAARQHARETLERLESSEHLTAEEAERLLRKSLRDVEALLDVHAMGRNF